MTAAERQRARLEALSERCARRAARRGENPSAYGSPRSLTTATQSMRNMLATIAVRLDPMRADEICRASAYRRFRATSKHLGLHPESLLRLVTGQPVRRSTVTRLVHALERETGRVL